MTEYEVSFRITHGYSSNALVIAKLIHKKTRSLYYMRASGIITYTKNPILLDNNFSESYVFRTKKEIYACVEDIKDEFAEYFI